MFTHAGLCCVSNSELFPITFLHITLHMVVGGPIFQFSIGDNIAYFYSECLFQVPPYVLGCSCEKALAQ